MRSLAVLAFFVSFTSSAQSQRVDSKVAPQIEVTLSEEEQGKLSILRQRGEAVFWVGSRECLSQLYDLFQEKQQSAAWIEGEDGGDWRYSIEQPVEMHARYENDMYYAQRRISIISDSCDGRRNAGDLKMTSEFLERTERVCRMTFQACAAKKRW